MTRQQYTLGFMFSPTLREVAMVCKARPAWQKGKLNGIGGKVESTDEDFHAAHRREFREETGVDHEEWDLVLMMDSPRFEIAVFRAHSNKVFACKTQPGELEEDIVIMQVHRVRDSLVREPHLFIDNMTWVLPYVLDCRYLTQAKAQGPIGGKIFY